MKPTEILANLPSEDLVAARSFYVDFLGLEHVDMGLDWVTRFVVPGGGGQVQLVTGDATAAVDSVMTVKVDDVDAAYAEANRRGLPIVHELTDEEWGIRRFFVRSPDGHVINIAQHNR